MAGEIEGLRARVVGAREEAGGLRRELGERAARESEEGEGRTGREEERAKILGCLRLAVRALPRLMERNGELEQERKVVMKMLGRFWGWEGELRELAGAMTTSVRDHAHTHTRARTTGRTTARTTGRTTARAQPGFRSAVIAVIAANRIRRMAEARRREDKVNGVVAEREPPTRRNSARNFFKLVPDNYVERDFGVLVANLPNVAEASLEGEGGGGGD